MLAKGYALIEPGNWYGFSNIQTTAAKDGGSFIIARTKLFVDYVRSADYILYVTKSPDEGTAVFLVKADSSGIRMNPFKTLVTTSSVKSYSTRSRLRKAIILVSG